MRNTDILKASHVTRREAEVLDAVGDRLTNAEIAERMVLSERTVESHVARLLRKLHVSNRRELADIARTLRGGGAKLSPQVSVLVESGPFVGRSDDLGRLRATWSRASVTGPLIAVVTGEPGIGKSRLVAELAAEAHEGGGSVLLGHCLEDGGRPYEPFVQLLTTDLQSVTDNEARRRLGAGSRVLARMLPAVAARFKDISPAADADPAGARVRMHDAVMSYLATAAESAPLLVVIEDAHWARLETLALIRHIVRTGSAPIMLAVTARDRPPDASEQLTEALAELCRSHGATHVQLDGLDRDELAELVGAVRTPTAQLLRERFVSALHEQTNGNPLFARELARALDEHAVQVRFNRLALPGGLRGLLATRLSHLRADDRSLLDLAAVIGHEFEFALISTTADDPSSHLIEGLERLERAGVIVAVPDRPGSFSFTHALVRDAVYDGVPMALRFQLHRRVAEAMEEASDADIGQLARHWHAAGPMGDPERTLRYAWQAGQRARSALAMGEAVAQYEAALDAGSQLTDLTDAARCELLTGYGEALHRAGDPRYRAVLNDALDVAEKLDDSHLAEIVFALNEHGLPARLGEVDNEFLSLVESALRRIDEGDIATRARLLAILAAEIAHLAVVVGRGVDRGSDGTPTSSDERRHALTEEAVSLARSTGDPGLLGRVLVSHHFANYSPDNLTERRRIGDEIIELGAAADDPTLVLQGRIFRYSNVMEAGDAEAAERELASFHQLGDALEFPFAGVRAFRAWGGMAARAADFDEAERSRREILAIGEAANLPYAPTVAEHVQWAIEMERGPTRATLDRLADESRGQWSTPVRAELFATAGRQDEATSVLEAFGARDFEDVPRNMPWLASMTLSAHVAALLEHREICAVLLRLLTPYEGRIGWEGPPSYPVDLALGWLNAALGEVVTALRCFDRAEQLAEQMSARTHVARVRFWRAALTGIETGVVESRTEMRAAGANGVLAEEKLTLRLRRQG